MGRLRWEGIAEYARSLGLLCGGAAAGPAQTHARYVEWLARGYHGQMNYLARPDAIDRRADVRRLLPQAKSVIVVAMNYYAEQRDLPHRAGKVARYAWSADYHRVIADRLGRLVKWIENQLGRPVAHTICVDTGAILEREWAVRAGLGWIGKNTMLINPRLGSWLLLGELLLDLELAFNLNLNLNLDRCGTCTRCIDACPMGCILPNRMLDARRCIAYLTIESRADIPIELRKGIGDWVFGCDICQEVCPWNRFAQLSALEINPDWTALDPAKILAMDQATFDARFAGSAICRARLTGLKRNAAALAP